MTDFQENREKILGLLKDNPRGLNIREIAELIGMSRTSATKYLDVLTAEEKIEVRSMGNAKVFHVIQISTPPALLNHVPSMILVLDANTRIIQANDHFLKYCSLSQDKVLGQPLTVIPGGITSEPAFIRALDDVIRTRTPLTDLTIEVPPEDITFRVTVKPTSPVADHFGLIAIINDISGEKRIMPERYRLADDCMQMLCEDIGVPVCIVQGGRIRLANSCFAAMSGYQKNELRSRAFLEFVYPEDKEMVRALYEGQVPGKTVEASGPFRSITKSGSVIWLDARAVPFSWKKEPASLFFCTAGNGRMNRNGAEPPS
ncbi:MAG: PAS domain S-box protein [Methanoregulaceae archaeon]